LESMKGSKPVNRGLSYSNSIIDTLVVQLEECCGDGIDCGRCPVAAQCVDRWDSVCQHLSREQYLEFAAHLAKLRNEKWLLSTANQIQR